ncbi:hypothetical protein GEMRC1_006679 [Eukaryota sp. GEM-RC1]
MKTAFGAEFELPERYHLLNTLGQGAYGLVCAAKDVQTGKKVAIKKINSAFENPVDGKRTLREIQLLRHLQHENIITLLDIIAPKSYKHFKDVYLVIEFMETDMYRIIQSPQPLTDEHCQCFIYQILRALKYMHSAHVIHRDLKPRNILLNANCDLRLCDFGLARVADPSQSSQEFLTQYVATRWYRAPEVLLASPGTSNYGAAMDIWAVGCIFGELLARRALFPGTDHRNQLQTIISVLGSPSPAEIDALATGAVRNHLKQMPFYPKVPMAKAFPNGSPTALDLLEKMLQFDPSNRITIEEALQHPYLKLLHDPEDEPLADKPFTSPWEGDQLTSAELKGMIYDEIRHYHPELPARRKK